jgi:hypothetical protein
VPFFSWFLLAWGGIPIDRSNRDQAIQAIATAAESAVCGDTVCVSPEGTRSPTGQLLPFKKGPFHLWEQLNKTSVIPLMIFGAFDLLPPGNLMPIPGKVYARFLPPLTDTSHSRDDMAYLLRKRMLLSWRDGPRDAGEPLSWKSRIVTEVYIFSMFYLTYLIFQVIPIRQWLKSRGLSYLQGIGLFLLVTFLITVVFYVYLMYMKKIMKLFFGRGRGAGASGSGGRGRSGSVDGESGTNGKRRRRGSSGAGTPTISSSATAVKDENNDNSGGK